MCWARRSEPVTARTVRDNSAERAWRDVGWIHIVPAQPSILSRRFGEVSEKPTCVDLTTGQRRRPSVVIVSRSAQDLFGDGSHVVDVTEKIRDVLRAGQQRQMSGDDDAIETVLYHGEPAAKRLRQGLHQSSFDSCVENKDHRTKTDGGQNFTYPLVALTNRPARSTCDCVRLAAV